MKDTVFKSQKECIKSNERCNSCNNTSDLLFKQILKEIDRLQDDQGRQWKKINSLQIQLRELGDD